MAKLNKRNAAIRRCRWLPLTLLGLTIVGLPALAGCRSYRNLPETIGNRTDEIDQLMRAVDRGAPPEIVSNDEPAPLTVLSAEQWQRAEFHDLSLEQALHLALSQAEVLRDLGATVLRAPQTLATEQTQALAETDPQFGMEAALSAFDAQFTALGKFQNNDRKFNNRFFGGGANAFQQDAHDYLAQISKRTATGAQLAVRSAIDYDANNATGNLYPSAWQSQLHLEARQPLLQGAGTTFNRIAGPGARPGIYNGVLIAQVNQDITSSQFRQGARDYVSNVINAYWDLYFAYRDLHAKTEALERSRLTWQSYEAQKSSHRGSAAAEALSREQYHRFESEFQDALSGKLVQRTQVNNASSGGSFAGVGGVQVAERRLRLLIGLPINDQQWLRPSDDPSLAPLIFDWDAVSLQALHQRDELQQQRLLIKRHEMEVLAARNFLMPQLDLVSIYRVRGLDHDLGGTPSALREMASFDYQEYEAGVELTLPIGFRQAHAAVRNAQIQVARQRAVLREQERQVLHDLSGVIAECDRARTQVGTNLNRYLAACDALEALEANREAGLPFNLEQLLDAQRRVSEAESRYYLSLAEYAVATKNVQYEKGSLLQHVHVHLQPSEAAAEFELAAVP